MNNFYSYRYTYIVGYHIWYQVRLHYALISPHACRPPVLFHMARYCSGYDVGVSIRPARVQVRVSVIIPWDSIVALGSVEPLPYLMSCLAIIFKVKVQNHNIDIIIFFKFPDIDLVDMDTTLTFLIPASTSRDVE